ncbi:hypothetical protein RYX36_031404 [Vicia faba]
MNSDLLTNSRVKDMNVDLLTGLPQIDKLTETVFSSEEGGGNCSAIKPSFCKSSPAANVFFDFTVEDLAEKYASDLFLAVLLP